MRFIAKSKEELLKMNLIEPGQYAYEVLSAKEGPSNAGNDMITLQLRIYDANDKAHLIYDFLLEKMAYKLHSFCQANGLEQKYQDGNLAAEDCLNKKGYAHVIIRKDKPENSIKEYIVSPNKTDNKSTTNTEDFVDSDIPF